MVARLSRRGRSLTPTRRPAVGRSPRTRLPGRTGASARRAPGTCGPTTEPAWTVDANQARPPAGGSYAPAALPAGAADVIVAVTVNPAAFTAANPDLGVVARVIDASNFVMFNFGWNGSVWQARVHQRVGRQLRLARCAHELS